MTLKPFPQLVSFFSSVFMESDPEQDLETAQSYFEAAPISTKLALRAELQTLLKTPELPTDDFGAEANRWFEGSDEARQWLESILELLPSDLADGASGSVEVRDCNGAVLSEGDSVLVIKDLKVKGGSSDLKRGTSIKKIHLIGDPDNIECRVGGSTLVLKTIFLKKD